MEQLYIFFNSNFFIALITLIVGAVAFVIFFLQKFDHKKDAANILLLEIQNAERAIKKIQENLAKEQLASDIFLMPSESWTRYKYLFLRNFDRDEWDSVEDFYNKCRLIDEDIRYNNSAFWSDVEQIRANKQRILADYSRDAVKEINSEKDVIKHADILEEYKKRTEKFDELYMERQGIFGYNPKKPINDAKQHMIGLTHNLSQTAVGLKLKKIARI